MIEKLFLCVGAQKAGTTWLHRQLCEHPALKFGPYKEVHYFDTLYCDSDQLPRLRLKKLQQLVEQRPELLLEYFGGRSNRARRLLRPTDDRWYMAQFGKPAEGGYVCDFTPDYALLPDAGWQHIAGLARELRIAFVMRDPAERSLSALRYVYQKRGSDIAQVPQGRLLADVSSHMIAARSDYGATIRRLRANFPQESLKFAFYEEVMREKATALAQFCDFLGVEQFPTPAAGLERRVNTTEETVLPPVVVERARQLARRVAGEVSELLGGVDDSWAYLLGS